MFKQAYTRYRLKSGSSYHNLSHQKSLKTPLLLGLLGVAISGLVYQTALDFSSIDAQHIIVQSNQTPVTLSSIALTDPQITKVTEPVSISEKQLSMVSQVELPVALAKKTEPKSPVKQQPLKVNLQQIADTKKPTKLVKPPVENKPIVLTKTIKKDHWLEATIKSGDSISTIFNRLGVSAKLLDKILKSDKKAKQLTRISPGQLLRIHLNKDGEFIELEHKLSKIKVLHIASVGKGFKTQFRQQDLTTKITELSATISSSLYISAKKAGLTNAMIMELTNIFRWDIDFARNIKAGDTLNIIFEEKLLDGKKYKNGHILAAEFNNQGKIYRAVAYKDKQGRLEYYTPEGKTLKKTFLQAPVDFRRISSRFSKSRKHPVYGRKRAHKGVDYAAATGTPIRAMADGKVKFRGKQRGYGNVVILKHGKKYSTLYAHMSRFRSKVKNGSWVKQGQIIGYVGMSGTATGPHLHYEFRVNGKHKDPLKHKIPGQQVVIAKKKRGDFKLASKDLLSRLDQMNNTMVASAGTSALNIQ